jgi:hypothetical protein
MMTAVHDESSSGAHRFYFSLRQFLSLVNGRKVFENGKLHGVWSDDDSRPM